MADRMESQELDSMEELKGWESEEQKPAVEQVESGGAGGKVELPELVYDHSPLTLGDWIAQVWTPDE